MLIRRCDVHVKPIQSRPLHPPKVLPNYSATIINSGLPRGFAFAWHCRPKPPLLLPHWLVYLKIIPRLTSPLKKGSHRAGLPFSSYQNMNISPRTLFPKQKQNLATQRECFSRRERERSSRRKTEKMPRKCVTWRKLLYNIFRKAWDYGSRGFLVVGQGTHPNLHDQGRWLKFGRGALAYFHDIQTFKKNAEQYNVYFEYLYKL